VNLEIIEKEHYQHVIFGNHQSRNSFSLDEVEPLQFLLKQKKAILWESSLPRTFCSGGNLKFYANHDLKTGKKANRKIRKFLNSFANHEALTLALVDGDCLGGGLEVLSAFDVVYATPSSLFSLWQRKIALSYGWGGGTRLEKRIGKQRLKDLSLSCALVDAYTAKNIGLIDGIFQRDKILEACEKRIEKENQLPQASFHFLKNFQRKEEAAFFEKIWGNPEHQKILERFRK
tara:strand:- start:206 stop:901 length:696 start_codon:yes stop_codon:yes gene_type:complete